MKTNDPQLALNSELIAKGTDKLTNGRMLNYAHQTGIKSKTTTIIQYPDKNNGLSAVTSTTVVTADDKIFTDIGEATPGNVPDG